MLINGESLHDEFVSQSDIAIIGAGPAGIVLSIELARAGFDVALIESGCLGFSKEIQSLSEANHLDGYLHAPMTECVRRQIGGTSVIWGGRCVPYDPVDFDQRDYIPFSTWPVSYAELSAYFQRTCDYFFCGDAEFSVNSISDIQQKTIVPGLLDESVLTSTLERWSLPTNFGREYLNELTQNRRIKLYYRLTCTEIELDEARKQAVALHTKTLSGKSSVFKARRYVLAAGALNTTRLLLASDRQLPGGIGNHSGLLGRFYMGHISGVIANICFTTPANKTIYGFEQDKHKIYLRRRFSFSREFLHEKQLSNIVAWLGTPQFNDPSHHNGILSSAYIALSLPVLKNFLTSTALRRALIKNELSVSYSAHIKNVLKQFKQIAQFLPGFAYSRFVAKRKVPALVVYSDSNEYPLHYHGEQIPNPSSKVTLSSERDQLGMRKLNIDLRYTAQDIDSVLRAHQYWDAYLRKYECGYLKYLTDDPECSIWKQVGDGYHQIGTTRMSASPCDGVVGPDCGVYGFDNLFVLSCSNFVTSSQANSTFMIVAFALRLADYLCRLGR